MSRRFKPVVLVLAFVVTFSLILSGCGGKKPAESTGTEKSTQAETSSAAEKAPALEPYAMNVVYACGAVPTDLNAVQEEMNKYLTEKINATVTLMPIDWGAWGDKTKLMFASGDVVDYIISSIALDYSANVAKGAYKPLNELIPKYGQDIVNLIGMDKINGTAVSGKIYGVPVWKEFGSSHGFVFNKELVDKYGFDISTIKKPEDLEPMLKTIKEKEPGVIPLNQYRERNVVITMLPSMYDIIGGFAGVIRYDSKDLKVIDSYNDAEQIALVQWSRKMFEAGYVNKSAITDKDEGAMKAGKAFCMPYELKPGKDSELSMAWGFPVVQKDIMGPTAPADVSKGIMGSIGNTSNDPDRVMMFMNMLYSDTKLLNLFVFGIEDKHYAKKNETTIELPAGVTADKITYKNEPWMFGNQFLNYLWTNEDPQKWEKYKAFNAAAKLSPALGFGFDGSNVKTEMAACQSVIDKYEASLFTGAIDPVEGLKKMSEEMKAAGRDTIIAEKQKQIDEWAKTK